MSTQRLVPVNLLQHALSSSFGLKTRLPFILEQLSCRTAILKDELLNKRGITKLLLPIHSPLQSKLFALDKIHSSYDSHDFINSASIYEAISTEILTYISLHKEKVIEIRNRYGKSDEESDEEKSLRVILSRTHMLSTSMRLLASSAFTISDIRNSNNGRALKVNRILNLSSLLRSSTIEVRAFCVEKFGTAPGVEISSNESASSSSIVGIQELVCFAYVELLKNAMTAMIARYTAAGVEDASDIKVEIKGDSYYVYITVTDSAVDLNKPQSSQLTRLYTHHPFRLFSSVAPAARQEIDYKYSREFGVPFSGSGLGLLRSELFCNLHGGNVQLFPSITNNGTSARIVLDRSGTMSDIEALNSIR